jgi:hypothetical protein
MIFESFKRDAPHVIGRNLWTLAKTQCIQTTHYAQDAKHQYEAIKENNNEYAKDHRFMPACTPVLIFYKTSSKKI